MTKRKENAVIITHGVNPDGIVSAAYIEDILRANGATWRSRDATR